MWMKRVTPILLILITGALPVFSQNSHNRGLVLRGVYAGWVKQEHKDYLCWTTKLAMEFVNEGTEPIILIDNNNGRFGVWKSRADLSADVLTRTGEMEQFDWPVELWGRCDAGYAYWREMNVVYGMTYPVRRPLSREKYDLEAPEQNLTIVIAPGRSVYFNVVLTIEQKFTTDNRLKVLSGPSTDISSADRQKGIPISWYDRIKLKYEYSFAKDGESDDFMLNLQTRWRKFGYLPVDGDSRFAITSEELRKN